MKYTPRLIAAFNDEDIGQKAKSLFVYNLKLIHNAGRQPKIILPTGNTPLPFYAALTENPDEIPSFDYWQLDEHTGLKPDNPALFANQLAHQVLDPLKITNRMIFNSAADPFLEVNRIREYHALNGPADMAWLGIGANDGHVGYNLPSQKFSGHAFTTKLPPEQVETNDRYGFGGVTGDVVTLGMSDIGRACIKILMARGESKADILAKAFLGEITPRVPASYLQTQPNVIILADKAALSKMPQSFFMK